MSEAGAPRVAVLRNVARRVLWFTTLTVLSLMSAYAVWRTVEYVHPTQADFPAPYGRAGLLFVALSLAVASALVLVAGTRWLHRRLPPRVIVAGIVIAAVVIRAALAIVADAPLTGENRIVNEQAVGVLDGVCCLGHRPMGYPVALAGVFSVLGIGPRSVEVLNVALAAVTTMLVWDIGRVTWGPRVGAVAAMGYAVTPSAVLLALVPLTEPLYTAIVVAVVRLGIGGASGWPLRAVATGAALSLAQYVRATAVILLLAVVAVAFLTEPRVSRALARTTTITLVFLLLLAPTISYNLEQHGDLSIDTSAYGGWSLFVGANQKFVGMWNREDAALLPDFPGESVWEQSKHARALAWERYTQDIGATLGLFVRKSGIMWGDERYAAAYALPTTESRGPTRDMWVGWLTSQFAWAALLMLAVIGTWRERRSGRPAALLVGLVLLAVAGSHLVLEVHSRYHAFVVPLLWLLAAAGLQHLRRRIGFGRTSKGPRPA